MFGAEPTFDIRPSSFHVRPSYKMYFEVANMKCRIGMSNVRSRADIRHSTFLISCSPFLQDVLRNGEHEMSNGNVKRSEQIRHSTFDLPHFMFALPTRCTSKWRT